MVIPAVGQIVLQAVTVGVDSSQCILKTFRIGQLQVSAEGLHRQTSHRCGVARTTDATHTHSVVRAVCQAGEGVRWSVDHNWSPLQVAAVNVHLPLCCAAVVDPRGGERRGPDIADGYALRPGTG